MEGSGSYSPSPIAIEAARVEAAEAAMALNLTPQAERTPARVEAVDRLHAEALRLATEANEKLAGARASADAWPADETIDVRDAGSLET